MVLRWVAAIATAELLSGAVFGGVVWLAAHAGPLAFALPAGLVVLGLWLYVSDAGGD